MASAAAYVCNVRRETSSQEVANQADKPANKRQVLRALAALWYIIKQTINIINN